MKILNPETGAYEPTPKELTRIPVSEEVKQLKQEKEELLARVSDLEIAISEMITG